MLEVQKTSLAWLVILTQRTHFNPPGIKVARTSFRKVENQEEMKFGRRKRRRRKKERRKKRRRGGRKWLPSWGGGLKPAEESLI